MLKNLHFIIFLLFFPAFVAGQTVCDSLPVSSRSNLGLYGGACNDLHYSPYTNRLFFAADEAPMSIFYSDDTANTWHNAFPYDSLYYECGQRGWGGSGKKVYSNKRGWVVAYTESLNDTLSASVTSFQNGDSGSWQTAIDPYLLSQLTGKTYEELNVTGIGLTEYFIYSLCNDYLVITDSANILSPQVYFADSMGISRIYLHKLISVAAKNDTTGFPVYLVYAKDSSSNQNNYTGGVLYKFDGNTTTLVDVPDTLYSMTAVFIPPQNTSDDTLLISGYDVLGNNIIYVSYDKGISWNNISKAGFNNQLCSVEYSPVYQTNILFSKPYRNGQELYSTTMGKYWTDVRYGSNPTSISISTFVRTYGNRNRYGLGMASSVPPPRQDLNLEAITINDILISKNKTEVYIATSAGMAYTTAYKNSTVISNAKFQSPYGEFPLASLDDNVRASFSAIDMDAEDSLHIITGKFYYIYMSYTGKDGFQQVPISEMKTNSTWVKDVKFINSQVILCVSANTNIGKSFIHRSADGGITWSNVTPTLFEYGKCIATGYSNNDTVIYIGTGYPDHGRGKGVLWKSTDLGITWAAINAGPTSLNKAVDSLSINAIIVDPRGTDTLYLASGYSLSPTQAFVKSTDGGLSYQQIDINDANGGFMGLEINKENPDSEVYVSSNRHVYYYNPALDSVTKIVSGYPGETVNTIAYGSILVGTTTGFYNLEQDDNGTYTNTNFVSQSKYVAVYPNPFSNYITIEIDNAINSTAFIYNIMGEVVYKASVASNNATINFDTKGLAPGMYFLKIVDTGNNTGEMRKLIKW